MNTLSENELSEQRTEGALVDELIGSVILSQTFDINAEHETDKNIPKIEAEYDELGIYLSPELQIIRNKKALVEIERDLVERDLVERDFIEADKSTGKRFVIKQIDTCNTSYSGDSLESLEQHNKHVRFDKSCDNKKTNKNVVYVNVPANGYVKFVWFVTGFLTGILGTLFVRHRIK